MIYEEKQEILLNAIDRHGDFHQIDMAIEECAELIQALSKMKRLLYPTAYRNILPPENKPPYPAPNGSIKYSLTYHAVCSEIADVKIMISQLENIFSKEAVNLAEERKLTRLKENLTK